MAGKRYYWLKLKDDFFSSKRIKKLRRLAGGDTFTIIYLKMQLLAMKSDGVLKWTGLEEDFASELALDLDEEPDNVKVTMNYLLSCGLAESSDNINYFLPYSVENVGSESSSAQRVRVYREKQKLLEAHDQSNEGVAQETSKPKKGAKKSDLFTEFASDDAALLKALRDFEQMRIKIKKPMTDRAKALLLGKLREYPPHERIPVLEQSTFHCWQSIYPLKGDDTGNNAGRGSDEVTPFDALKALHSQYEVEG